MKLYYSDVLSAHKACAVAQYLDSPVEYVYLDLGMGEQRTPDYVALNPNAKVPTLVDGQRVLWEADAIMCHLAARAGSNLWPDDYSQIEVIRWLSWNHQHFTRAGGTLFFEYIVRERFNLGPADANEVES
ncbi:MAG: glutathione S-transferase N-terminal domain-containing protein, partial [Rhodanobacteraceae bacterium]